mmetsp:Transcript_37515/g.99862  ORF Transcript_37515/g.99862 Transcript_37515/m.99862 type:complete len:337 (-) Transcript_37515:6387-7397(-)
MYHCRVLNKNADCQGLPLRDVTLACLQNWGFVYNSQPEGICDMPHLSDIVHRLLLPSMPSGLLRDWHGQLHSMQQSMSAREIPIFTVSGRVSYRHHNLLMPSRLLQPISQFELPSLQQDVRSSRATVRLPPLRRRLHKQRHGVQRHAALPRRGAAGAARGDRRAVSRRHAQHPPWTLRWKPALRRPGVGQQRHGPSGAGPRVRGHRLRGSGQAPRHLRRKRPRRGARAARGACDRFAGVLSIFPARRMLARARIGPRLEIVGTGQLHRGRQWRRCGHSLECERQLDRDDKDARQRDSTKQQLRGRGRSLAEQLCADHGKLQSGGQHCYRIRRRAAR